MNFKEFLRRLENKETVEQITQDKNVECIGNIVYEDDNFYDFLHSIDAEIEDIGVGYALIRTSDGEYYEVPYENKVNRFGDDLPDETILNFESNEIYDVTEMREWKNETKAVDIKWDTDGNDKLLYELPTEVKIPQSMTDINEISDWLSNQVGFCHNGFKLRKVKKGIEND